MIDPITQVIPSDHTWSHSPQFIIFCVNIGDKPYSDGLRFTYYNNLPQTAALQSFQMICRWIISFLYNTFFYFFLLFPICLIWRDGKGRINPQKVNVIDICYWPDIDDTLKVGSWDYLEKILTVTGTYVHIRNILAVTDSIRTKLYSQGQGKVKARSMQDKGKVNTSSRQGQGKVRSRSRQG